jgi:hypothetical protein
VDYHEDLLFTDSILFNQRMSDWLVLYNNEPPHLSTKPNPKKTATLTNLPVPPKEFLFKSHPQSSMYWTNTSALHFRCQLKLFDGFTLKKNKQKMLKVGSRQTGTGNRFRSCSCIRPGFFGLLAPPVRLVPNPPQVRYCLPPPRTTP